MKRVIWVVLLTSAASATAFAADMPVKAPVAPPVPYVDDFIAANNQVILQAIGTNLDYAEIDDGRFGDVRPGTFADGERGWVPGIGAKASVMQHIIWNNDYVAVEGSYSKGTLDYTQGPALGLLFQRHDAEFDDAAIRFGEGFTVAPRWMVTPFAEFGYHRWVRSVNAGETYEHEYGGGGVMIQYNISPHLILSATGMVGSTIDPKVAIAANPGANTAFTVGLGTDVTWRAGLGFDYAFLPQWHVSGEANYSEFRYGASSTVFVPFAAFEPESRSHVTTLKLGIGYSWGAPAVVAKY